MELGTIRLLRLVVASPGDVQHERDSVQTVVSEVNRGIAAELGFRIEVMRWETDAFPAFHPQGPQDLIDSVLAIEDCDILVGIFWKRFGTPTLGVGSGTEHEIRIAREAWLEDGSPHIMLYFNKEPYSPESPQELEQWLRVLEFRGIASEWGLWWPYHGPADFERLFREHLTQVVRRLAKATLEEPGHEPAVPESHELADRRDYISRYCALIAESVQEILLSSSKLHKSEESSEAEEINRALREARERGVEVRILVADGYDRLPGALELARELGIPVRLDQTIHLSDINYASFDRRSAIVASRSVSGSETGYRPSFSWVEFSGGALASTLADDFQRRWRAPVTRSTGQYLRERLRGITLASSLEDVARYLAMPEEMVDSYAKAHPTTVLLLGRPGSGKTTVARALQTALETAGAPEPVKWFSDVTYLWQIFGQADHDARVEATEDGGYVITDSTIWDTALKDLADRARREGAHAALILLEFSRANYTHALEILAENDVQPDLVVYLDVPFEIALHRNRQRATIGASGSHYVSEREMRTTFAADDVEQLKAALGDRLLLLPEPDEPIDAVRDRALQIVERLKEE